MKSVVVCSIILAGCGRLGFAELGATERTTSSTTLAVGLGHACSRTVRGEAYCWGSNRFGQVGIGSLEVAIDRPAFIGDGWDSLSAGKYHTCGLRDSELWCFGDNSAGQLGLGFSDASPHSSPERVGADTGWVGVSAGRYHTCAIRDDATLWCWGYNDEGNLGLGDRRPRAEPTRVGAEADWVSVTAGGGYGGFAQRTDGTTWAWGENQSGELGIGDTTIRERPVDTSRSWATVGAGVFATCALDEERHAWCWGDNDYGQLGVDDHADRHVPARVDQRAWMVVSAMESFFTCGIDLEGSLFCWGTNDGGGLGVGDTLERRVPTRVETSSGWTDVRGGGGGTANFACGVNDANVYCWGTNDAGQLGLGDRSMYLSPQLTLVGEQ